MLFNSLAFFLFFPAVAILYFVIPHKFRLIFLLLASLVFYGYFSIKYLSFLLVLLLMDYLVAILMSSCKPERKKLYLYGSIGIHILFMIVFKYLNFFADSINSIFQIIHWNYPLKTLQVLMPLGLSFLTLQSLSYLLDVYRGKQKPERHLGVYVLYILFFPKLFVGPIEKPSAFLPQFYEKHLFNDYRVRQGLERIAIGLFKKVVIADRLAPFTSHIYANPTEYMGIPLLFAIFGFAYQVYADLSGLTDIAIGASQILGFRLSENFDYPYIATSIADFWHRWNITVTNWFGHYVFGGLGGARVSKSRYIANLFVTFILTGFWYGAGWTFIFWGALHAGLMILETHIPKFIRKYLSSWQQEYPTLFRRLTIGIVFIVISVTWIFFRAKTMSDAFYIITHMFGGLGTYFMNLSQLRFGAALAYFAYQGRGLGIELPTLFSILICIAFMEIYQFLDRNRKLASLSFFYKWALYAMAVFGVINLGIFNFGPLIR